MLPTKISVGFIGLGSIGGRVAWRLLDHGYSLIVNDTSPEAVKPFQEKGAKAASSPRAVAQRASVIFACLPTPYAVEQVALGSEGVVAGIKEDTIFIDLSTSGVEVEQKIARELGVRGAVVLDSPVSGGIEAAERGTLSIITAGQRETFEKSLELLEVFGGKIFHVSERPGQGQALKLVNNLIAATSFAVTSEALVLATKSGLDPEVVVDVINASSGRTYVSEHRFPKIVGASASRNGFSSPRLLHKDLVLTGWLARQQEVPLLVGRIVEAIYELALNGDTLDGTDILEFYKRTARISEK